MQIFESLQNYFSPLIERIFHVNTVPSGDFIDLPDHFYFYAIILLGFSLFLIFKGLFLMRQKFQSPTPKYPIPKYLIHFVLIIWLVTSVRWLIIQGHWIKNDLIDFKGLSIIERQRKVVARLVQNRGIPSNWYNFYDFLEFTKNEIPYGSGIYLLPTDPTFNVWGKYWLYPNLHLVDSSKKADYIISFNVELPDQVIGFKKFKEFGLNKVILIGSDLINNL